MPKHKRKMYDGRKNLSFRFIPVYFSQILKENNEKILLQGEELKTINSAQLLPFVTAIVRSIVDMAIKKKLGFRLDIPENLEVFADENMLASTLHNLCTNSVKFTPSGGFISMFAKAAENNFVEIEVKDNGIGMNHERVKNLFKLGKNISRSGTENEPSTGLGLLLCKELVEKNKGKIWVESEVGIGTTFYISLPSFVKNE